MSCQWTGSQIRAARQRPLKPVLETLGYGLQPRPDGNYEVLGMTAQIVIKDHYWVRLDDGTARPVPARDAMSGNAIDFFVKLQGMSFQQAMQLLAEAAP